VLRDGLAATTVLCLALLRANDHVVVSQAVYGGTVRLFNQVLAPFGVKAEFRRHGRMQQPAQSSQHKTHALCFHRNASQTNAKTYRHRINGRIAHESGALLVVDNTLLTPALQKPFALQADVVLHSTTKFIEGHNATVGGALITSDAELHERFSFTRNAIGAIQSPFPAWLTLQGVKTVGVRMAQHSENALRVARFLETHPQVTRLLYPGLESFPQFELARKQQTSGGALIAFEIEGGVEAGIRLMNSVKLCALAENLGSAETLITHPASMTHADVPQLQRQTAGITDGLVRLSVGLEDAVDIINDLSQALAQTKGAA
jgi:cystathionine beta-lyase/cystathionine gamma-synthase